MNGQKVFKDHNFFITSFDFAYSYYQILLI